jgi:SRP54-type protein, helical bundle domain
MMMTDHWLFLWCHVTVSLTLVEAAFVSPSRGIAIGTARVHPALFFKRIPSSSSSGSKSELNMVFDFLSERSKEGMKQLSNLAQAGYKGELGKGLTDIVVYTAQTNQAFANGLAKSRIQLLDNLESLFTGTSPLEDVLEDLTDILLQADLGLSTAEDIVAEVKSLYQSSNQKRLSKDDLKSIMRGKLIEAFQSSNEYNNDDNDDGVDDNADTSRRIQFSTDPNIPTVLFIMGANGMGKVCIVMSKLLATLWKIAWYNLTQSTFPHSSAHARMIILAWQKHHYRLYYYYFTLLDNNNWQIGASVTDRR